eukprot:5725778-Prorocentrum_lima.AAC.1
MWAGKVFGTLQEWRHPVLRTQVAKHCVQNSAGSGFCTSEFGTGAGKELGPRLERHHRLCADASGKISPTVDSALQSRRCWHVRNWGLLKIGASVRRGRT